MVRLTDRLDMTIDVYWDVTPQHNNKILLDSRDLRGNNIPGNPPYSGEKY